MMNIFIHSYFLIVAVVLAFWVPTWLLPFKYGFNSENEGYVETNLSQYNTITFITYPINLNKMSDVRKYNITFTSMLSISKFTKLIIFEQSSKSDLHDELSKILTTTFGERRISFITNEDQFEQESNLSSLTDFSARAISQVRTKFACYINANVAVDPFWYDRIMTLFAHFFEADSNAHIYVTGRRIQIPLSKKEIKEFTNLPSITTKNFFKSLRKLIQSKKDDAKCIKQCESDYFIVSADPSPFDLRYLPEFRLTGGFFSMYLNYLAESKENSYSANEQVPVYYLGSLPDVNDIEYKEDSQFNYDIIKNNSYHVTKNSELRSKYDGNTFINKWAESEINESSYSPILSNITCSEKNDMANITLTKFSTIDYYQFQSDNVDQFNRNNFGLDGNQNPNEENGDDYEKKEKNSDDDENSGKNKEEEDDKKKEKNDKNEESSENKKMEDESNDNKKKKKNEESKENKKRENEEEDEKNENKKKKNDEKEEDKSDENKKKKNEESKESKKKENEEEDKKNESKKKKENEESKESNENKKKKNEKVEDKSDGNKKKNDEKDESNENKKKKKNEEDESDENRQMKKKI